MDTATRDGGASNNGSILLEINTNNVNQMAQVGRGIDQTRLAVFSSFSQILNLSAMYVYRCSRAFQDMPKKILLLQLFALDFLPE